MIDNNMFQKDVKSIRLRSPRSNTLSPHLFQKDVKSIRLRSFIIIISTT